MKTTQIKQIVTKFGLAAVLIMVMALGAVPAYAHSNYQDNNYGQDHPYYGGNDNGYYPVQQVRWNLSGSVMPVPPYGGSDIPGSEVYSRLMVVRQGFGHSQIIGIMRGLEPNSTYTVYLSQAYSPETGWPGLATGNIQPFTFNSNENGVAVWRLTLDNSDLSSLANTRASIWINNSQGATILISNDFNIKSYGFGNYLDF